MVNENVKKFAMYVAAEAGLDASLIDIYDNDLYRVYFNYNNEDYTIRMWDINNTEVLSYTLFITVKDATGSHGESVYRGEHYKF